MRPLDLICFGVYIIIILGIGVYFYTRSGKASQFTIGDQSIPAWVLSLSIFATFVSSISYLALPGSAYQGNWNSFVFSLSLPLAAFMAVKYFVPIYRKVNSPSAFTYLENRFGLWARLYASIMYLLTQIMRMGTIVYLMALVPNMMFGWNITLVIVFTSFIVMIYSLLGGIRAVVWTDAIQAIVLIAGAIITILIISFKLENGLATIVSTGMAHNKFSLGNFSTSLSQSTFWVVLVYGVFINLQNFGIDQNYIQRYMTSKSLLDAQRSAFWGAMLYIPTSLLFLFIGTALFTIYQAGTIQLPENISLTQSDKVFPYFIANEMPAGITGLLLASIFSAGMSTISTSYNSGATIILTDYFEKFSKNQLTDKAKLRILYISTAAISILGTIVGTAMINAKSALDTWWKMASIFSGGALGLFLLSAFTKVKDKVAAVLSVAFGLMVILLITLTGLAGDKSPVIHPYLTIVFGTTTIFIVGTVLGFFLERYVKNKKL